MKAPGAEALTAERARALFSYDPDTGELRNRVRRGNVAAGAIAGTRDADGRLRVAIDGRRYYLHRVVWLMLTGEWPSRLLVQINGDGGDIHFANLQPATAS